MKKYLEIIEVEERTSKKSGNKYRVCQCILIDSEGKKKVGELMVFNKDIPLSEGTFQAEFDVTVNFDKNVSAELVALIPFDPSAVGAAAVKNSAK